MTDEDLAGLPSVIAVLEPPSCPPHDRWTTPDAFRIYAVAVGGVNPPGAR